MKKIFTTQLTIVLIVFAFAFSFAQSEQCGTMQNLQFQLQKDPSLKFKLDSIEINNSNWIKNNNRGFKQHYSSLNNRENFTKVGSDNTITNSFLCNYDNIFFTSINAPTVTNQIVSPSPNCTYGGEYVRVNNLIAGNTYRISTVGLNNFNTVMTIYTAGGGNPVAYNDDWSTSIQSEIYFTPFVSGNYDILIDQLPCLSNQICASLQVELWYVPRPVITIPVVVHVIHKGEPVGTGTNISDAQIQSQIDVLNQDFRRLNSDVLFSPAPFRGSSADALIQFCLAQQKPDGSSTNGIVRRQEPSEQEYITLGIPPDFRCLNLETIETVVKPVTIWDREKYLNIWVSDFRKSPQDGGCSVQSATLGYAQFPGIGGPFSPEIPANLTDGVFLRYNVFGTIGNVIAPYNLGRTATHEVGHWLNLKHIWGDEPNCTVDDLVLDTPLQNDKSSGCFSFPNTDSCSPNFPGIMFMNYMDYSVDNCLSIFTYGQSARMDSALFNQRISLLTSNGCEPSSLSLNEDIFESLIKSYPNPFSNQITFEANEPINQIEIYNLLGQKVKSLDFRNNPELTKTIDLSELSIGHYIARVSVENTIRTVKIIKR